MNNLKLQCLMQALLDLSLQNFILTLLEIYLNQLFAFNEILAFFIDLVN